MSSKGALDNFFGFVGALIYDNINAIKRGGILHFT